MLYEKIYKRLQSKFKTQNGAVQCLAVFNEAFSEDKDNNTIIIDCYNIINAHKTWSVNTKEKIWHILSATFRSEYESTDKYLKTLKMRKQEVIKEYLSEIELKKLYENQLLTSTVMGGIKKCNSDTLKACIFSSCTGLRISDLKRLTWDDIYDGKINIAMKKTGKIVIIPLNTRALEVLDTLKKTSDKGYVFKFPLSERALLTQIARWCEYNGIRKKVGVHTFRHSFAQNLYEKGVQIPVISKLLGHSDIHQTMTYIRLRNQDMVDAVHALG